MAGPLDIAPELIVAANQPDASLKDRVDAARKLLLFGCVGEAMAAARNLMGHPDAGQNALLRICRRIIDGESILSASRPVRIRNETPGSGDVMVAPGIEPRRVIVIFAGRGVTFMGPHDAVFAERPDTSLIFLRNQNDCMFMADIDGLGCDYPTCLETLRTLVAAVGPPDPAQPALYLVGLSVGGYAALRFGLDLGARGVLGFSTITTLDPADWAALPSEELLNLSDSGRALQKRAPEMAVDLRSLYAAALRRPKLIFSYGAAHRVDTWAAERMVEVASPDLQPIADYDGHKTVQEARRQRLLDPLVERLMAI